MSPICFIYILKVEAHFCSKVNKTIIRQSLKKQTLCDKQSKNVSIMAYRVTVMKSNYNKWSSNYLYKYKWKVLFTSTYSTVLYETGHHTIWVEVPFHLINDQNKQYSQTQVK